MVVIGGGLAGLTLALEVRRALPSLDVAVLERTRYPVPEIIHKIGESTVELGSWYLANTLGLRGHLDKRHLRKFGLRFFFGADGRDIEWADELGASEALATPTWQVDRGRLENELADRVRAMGVSLIDGARATRLELDGCKRVHFESVDGAGTLDARWVVDAAGRSSLVKRTFDLARRNDHDVNASWFRVQGEVRIDHWSKDRDWQSRTGGRPRWLSTNQLMGTGYWVWIIPLASDATSIGIVADPRYHALDEIKTLRASKAWLRRHEPRLAAALEGQGHPVLDFGFLRHFSHDCERVFSADRWALTGEAGVFLDPLYSPGTDFIAIGNGFVTDLVARDLDGENIHGRSRALETVYRSFYENSLSLYLGLYGGFGSSRFMVLKTTWDYCYYWSLLALLYTNGGVGRLVDDVVLRDRLLAGAALNRRLQRSFRAMAEEAGSEPGAGRFFDQRTVPVMDRLNAQLSDRLDGDALSDRISENVAQLERLAEYLGERMKDPARSVSGGERELLGDFPSLLSA